MDVMIVVVVFLITWLFQHVYFITLWSQMIFSWWVYQSHVSVFVM